MSEPSFDQWLSRQLRLRDWSGSEFARRLDAHPSTVSFWLRGERIPNPKFCERISDALDLDVETVLAVAGHYRPLDPMDADSIETRLVSLVRAIKWDEDRAGGIEGILRAYREFDRRKGQQGGG